MTPYAKFATQPVLFMTPSRRWKLLSLQSQKKRIINSLGAKIDERPGLIDRAQNALGYKISRFLLGSLVEPSPHMRASLQQIAAEAGIDNITVVAKRWDDAEVPPADVVISAHVIYMVEDIQAFVVKLVAHARKQVL